ncbi:MAG: galactose mutarotase [Bacteroidetes bacterium]|nr:MAG: galactose mutarotase [Bacteroidota bacterium]
MNRSFFFILLSILSSSLFTGCQDSGKPDNSSTTSNLSVMKEPFGTMNNREVFLYTLTNSSGIVVKITNYGGIITQIWTPDRRGEPGDIVLGYDSLKGYIDNNPYFGAIVGRYANRIAKGQFKLMDTTYHLATNNGDNHLHGGAKGFDKVVWDATEIQDSSSVGLELTYLSQDGEEGYPGSLRVKVTYILNDDNELKTIITATTDKPCPVNLCNHTYFNLNKADTNILGHILSIVAAQFTDVDDDLIPTGDLPPVAGTPMDFNTPHEIGSQIEEVKGGYDHNYVLDKTPGDLALAATLLEPKSGREVKIYTTQPGLQFYSGNFLDGSIRGKDGKVYNQHYGLCLETQHFPDSPNHPNFPNTILRPGETYREITVYKFRVAE